MNQVKPAHETYYPQLDGVRFLAVLAVVIDHWLGEIPNLPLGFWGVNIFFVLSGYLITGILLRAKIKNEAGGLSHWPSIRSFIIRRSLRIFPIYYVLIAVLVVLNVPPVRQYLGWYLTYTPNILIALQQQWLGSTDHLWSLAVEEQFYLVFPWLVFFTPRKYLLPLFWGMIALAVGLRVFFWLRGSHWVVGYCLMPTNLDALVGGSLLAYVQTFAPARMPAIRKQGAWLALGATGLALLMLYLRPNTRPASNFTDDVAVRFLFSVAGFWFIAQAAHGFGGVFGRLLQWGPVVYFGRISYGIYLFHNFVFSYFHSHPDHPTLRLLHKISMFSPQLAANPLFRLLLFWTLVVAAATLSWYFIEKPINNLKRFFRY